MKFPLPLFALLLTGGCVFTKGPPRIHAPNPQPPPVFSVEEITPEKFNELDSNRDGALSPTELSSATTKDSLSEPLQIFSILLLAIAIICIIPAIPALTAKVGILCKKYRDKES